MRVVYLLIFLLSSMCSSAQFMGVGHEKTETALLLFEDGTIREGIIKNIPMNYMSKVESSHKNRPYNKIKFYIKKNGEYEKQEVYRKDVKQVQLKTKEGEFHEYSKVYFLELLGKNDRISETEKFMYAKDNGLIGFRRYTYVLTIYNRFNQHDEYCYLIQHPVFKEYYHLFANRLVKRKNIINLMRLLGSECPAFLDYLDEIDDLQKFYTVTKSIEKFVAESKNYPESMEVLDEQGNVISKILNTRSQTYLTIEYLISYFYQKYLEFGCTPESKIE